MIVLKGPGGPVDYLRFTADGLGLIAAPSTKGVLLWTRLTESGRPAVISSVPRASAAHPLPCGHQYLIEAAYIGFSMAVYDRADDRTTRVDPDPLSTWAGTAAVTPDATRFIAVQSDRAKGSHWLFCRAFSDPARSAWSVMTTRLPHGLFFGPDPTVLTSVEYDTTGTVFVTHRVQDGAAISEVRPGVKTFAHPVASSDRRLVAGRREREIYVLHTEDVSAGLTIRNDTKKDFTGHAFYPSGRHLAATSNDNTVKVYDTATGQATQSFDWHIGRLRSIAFSPDGCLAAVGGDKGQIVVWDVDL